ATLTLSEGTTNVPVTVANDGTGTFTTAPLTFPLGAHTLTAVQSGPAKASPPATLKFVVVDPNAPAPPVVKGSSLSAANGRLGISGTAPPNTTVTVSGPNGTRTAIADANGVWTLSAT